MFKTNAAKYLLRFVVIGALAAPFGLMYVLVPWTLSNVWVVMIFKALVPCLCIGLVIFAFSHYFFMKFNLLMTKEELAHLRIINDGMEQRDPLLASKDDV